MTVTPEALQAAAIDLRVQANEVSSTLENAVLLVTAAAIRKGDVDDQITRAVAAERQRWRTVLADHYLMNVICNEATKQDNPVCGCSLVFLGWHNSIDEARQAWIDHVLAVVTGEQP